MALSRATLVQRVRWELGGLPGVWEDSGSAANATSTITGVGDGADWAEGDIGEFITDGDTFRVTSVSGTTITATRSYDGSTGAAHTAERILKNPRYRFNEITNAIEAVIQERLWPKAYKKVGDTVTPDPTNTTWYDLAADARGLIQVVQRKGTANQELQFFGFRHQMGPRVVFERNLPTALVASGVGLRFPDGFSHATNVVTVDYAAKITDAVTGGSYDDLTDGDIVVEAIIYGAVSHLEGALENRKPRKPRQDRETLRGAALYERKFQEALDRTQQELRDTIPLMRKFSHG